jgi:hypothetical protein
MVTVSMLETLSLSYSARITAWITDCIRLTTDRQIARDHTDSTLAAQREMQHSTSVGVEGNRAWYWEGWNFHIQEYALLFASPIDKT